MTLSFARNYHFLYALAMLVLAVLGAQASIASLIAGGASAILLMIGTLVSVKYPKPAFIGLLLLSLALLGRFLPAFLQSGTFYPSGIIALLAAIGAVVSFLVLVRKSA